MFRFTIRQLMLVTFAAGVILTWPRVDRQILWMRLRAEHARCVKANDELRNVIGSGTFIPYDPDASPYLPKGMWEDRSKLVRELEQMTGKAKSLEGTVKKSKEFR